MLQHSATAANAAPGSGPITQNNNVWSYPTSTDEFLNIDPDPEHGIIMCQRNGRWARASTTSNVNWANATETERTSQSTTELRYGLAIAVRDGFDPLVDATVADQL